MNSSRSRHNKFTNRTKTLDSNIMNILARRVPHFVRRRTASFVRRLGSIHVQTTSSRTTGADNVFRRSRLSSKQQSLYAQLDDSDFCRGVANARENGSQDLRLSWRLTPSWNTRSCTLTQRSKCCRRLSAVYSVCLLR